MSISAQALSEELLEALLEIDEILFAAGAPHGSDNYFAIREICADILVREGVPIRKELT